jgi:hypothetical protein
VITEHPEAQTIIAAADQIGDKMDTKFFLPLVLVLVSVPMASAADICIDNIPPSAPSSLVIADSPYDADGNILLSWAAATDLPECSGIDHYNIYRSDNGADFTLIGESYTLSFDDMSSLPEGTYYYRVTAVDKVKFMPHEGPAVEGSATVGQAPPSPPSGGGGSSDSSGGGGWTYTPPCDEDWACSDWSECIDNLQTRECTDQNACGTEESKPPETQACTPSGMVCTEGAYVCAGNSLMECIDGSWELAETCEHGCASGACVVGEEETQEAGFSITGLFLNPAFGYGLAILVIIALAFGAAWKARRVFSGRNPSPSPYT